jgi:hypothetical protein
MSFFIGVISDQCSQTPGFKMLQHMRKREEADGVMTARNVAESQMKAYFWMHYYLIPLRNLFKNMGNATGWLKVENHDESLPPFPSFINATINRTLLINV